MKTNKIDLHSFNTKDKADYMIDEINKLRLSEMLKRTQKRAPEKKLKINNSQKQEYTGINMNKLLIEVDTQTQEEVEKVTAIEGLTFSQYFLGLHKKNILEKLDDQSDEPQQKSKKKFKKDS